MSSTCPLLRPTGTAMRTRPLIGVSLCMPTLCAPAAIPVCAYIQARKEATGCSNPSSSGIRLTSIRTQWPPTGPTTGTPRSASASQISRTASIRRSTCVSIRLRSSSARPTSLRPMASSAFSRPPARSLILRKSTGSFRAISPPRLTQKSLVRLQMTASA